MFLRRVDPNILARERANLAERSARPTPVSVRVGDCFEPGLLYGWARADSERSGKGLVLTIREIASDLQEEVLRWTAAASVVPRLSDQV